MEIDDRFDVDCQPPEAETSAVRTHSRRGSVIHSRDFVAGAVLAIVAGVLLTAGGFTARSGLSPSVGLLFTIPAGAKATVPRPGFDSAIPIPTDIRFASPTEAIITVQNLDDVEHRAGPFLVSAGQAFVQRFPEPGRYPLVCSVDPLESVVVTVEG
jgi:hypothetical protein